MRATAAAAARCIPSSLPARAAPCRASAASATRLAGAVARVGQLDDALLAGALAAGRIASLAAMLAVRVGIPFDDARAMLTDPSRCAVLLRACDVAPETAGAMIIALAYALDRGFGDEPGEAASAIIAEYGALGVERARAEVRRVRLEPHYREALAALSEVVR
ncbi:MAG TPA: DUF2336 domain-containing protein [Sphingomonas sp.]